MCKKLGGASGLTGKIRAELLTHWSIHTAGQPAEMNLSNSCTALHIQFPVQLSDQERASKELYVSLYNSGQLKPVTLHTGALTKSIQVYKQQLLVVCPIETQGNPLTANGMPQLVYMMYVRTHIHRH